MDDTKACAICYNDDITILNPCDCKGSIGYCIACLTELMDNRGIHKCSVCSIEFTTRKTRNYNYRLIMTHSISIFFILIGIVSYTGQVITASMRSYNGEGERNVLYHPLIVLFMMLCLPYIIYIRIQELKSDWEKLCKNTYKFTPINKSD
jgi:hypothetical protein